MLDMFVGDWVDLAFSPETHRLTFMSTSDTTGHFSISSTTTEFDLSVGQTSNFDVTGDGVSDLSIELRGLVGTKATLFLKKLAPPPAPTISPQQTQASDLISRLQTSIAQAQAAGKLPGGTIFTAQQHLTDAQGAFSASNWAEAIRNAQLGLGLLGVSAAPTIQAQIQVVATSVPGAPTYMPTMPPYVAAGPAPAAAAPGMNWPLVIAIALVIVVIATGFAAFRPEAKPKHKRAEAKPARKR